MARKNTTGMVLHLRARAEASHDTRARFMCRKGRGMHLLARAEASHDTWALSGQLLAVGQARASWPRVGGCWKEERRRCCSAGPHLRGDQVGMGRRGFRAAALHRVLRVDMKPTSARAGAVMQVEACGLLAGWTDRCWCISIIAYANDIKYYP